MNQVNVWELKVGDRIKIKTQHSHYCLDVVNQDRDVKIQGGQYFSESQIVFLRGSIKGGIIQIGLIEVDHALELVCENGKIIHTSLIKEIELNGP